jgi:hypothetical protein
MVVVVVVVVVVMPGENLQADGKRTRNIDRQTDRQTERLERCSQEKRQVKEPPRLVQYQRPMQAEPSQTDNNTRVRQEQVTMEALYRE